MNTQPNRIILRISNPNAGIDVRLAHRYDGKYAVSVLDTDAGEVVPVIVIFEDQEKARAYAHKCASC